MRIVLDTGVLWKPAAIRRLKEERREAVVPAAAYAERLRQLERDGRSRGEFDDWLDRLALTVEPLTRERARRVAPSVAQQHAWRKLAFDALIASHMEPDDELWTTNPRDFATLGVPAEQIIAVE